VRPLTLTIWRLSLGHFAKDEGHSRDERRLAQLCLDLINADPDNPKLAAVLDTRAKEILE
jgi:hypothetical protein